MGQTKENYRNLRRIEIMLLLTTIFFLVEMIVGYATRAIVLISDSFHMLSDVVALIVAYTCIRLSEKKWSQSTFGWSRAEILGSLINAVFLCALCFSVFIESIKRFYDPEEVKNPKLVLYVGVGGLVVNLIGLFMFSDCHTMRKKGQSADNEDSASQMNIRAVFIHLLADAIGSIIVIISSCIQIYTTWKYKIYVDPALSILS
ncbi:zinc/cadmium resistance protein-like protein, partial [Leptotrombidium deliense]